MEEFACFSGQSVNTGSLVNKKNVLYNKKINTGAVAASKGWRSMEVIYVFI